MAITIFFAFIGHQGNLSSEEVETSTNTSSKNGRENDAPSVSAAASVPFVTENNVLVVAENNILAAAFNDSLDGNYASPDGNYARQDGDYASQDGDYASQDGDYATLVSFHIPCSAGHTLLLLCLLAPQVSTKVQ